MAETYCGKSCTDCSRKEELSCPGCRPGPGRELGGTCELAMCCRRKGHETCETCSYRGNCATLRKRTEMPEYRLQKIEADRMVQRAVAKRAPLLGKWLWILFWLVIPANVASILSAEQVVQWLPQLRLPGEILGTLCNLAYALIMLRLAGEEDRYKTAGICMLICAAAGVVMTFVSGAGELLLITLPVAIAGLVGEYNEFMGHASVLRGVDNAQADHWELLWKWQIGLYIGLIVSAVILALAPILGVIVMIVLVVGILAVSIMKLVYLYRTAQIFRNYQPIE